MKLHFRLLYVICLLFLMNCKKEEPVIIEPSTIIYKTNDLPENEIDFQDDDEVDIIVTGVNSIQEDGLDRFYYVIRQHNQIQISYGLQFSHTEYDCIMEGEVIDGSLHYENNGLNWGVDNFTDTIGVWHQNENDQFMGFRFFKDDKTMYGWARFTEPNYEGPFILLDYAYNTIDGGSIAAGQKSNGQCTIP